MSTAPGTVSKGGGAGQQVQDSRYDALLAHRRRRAAAARMSGGDPLTYAEVADCISRDQDDDERPSQKMTHAGLEAAEHLLHHGLVPLVHVPTLRALYRRGGDTRRQALWLARMRGVA